MKLFIKTMLLALLITASSVSAEHHMNMSDDMAHCDTNKDGMISKDEFIKSKTEMFTKMDKDANGSLNAEEQKMMMEKMRMMMKDDHAAKNGM